MNHSLIRFCSSHKTTVLIMPKSYTYIRDFFFFNCNHRAAEGNGKLRKKAAKVGRKRI